MIVKIQYHNYEEGEFESWDNITTDQTLKLFDEIDWEYEFQSMRDSDEFPSFVIQKNDYIVRVLPISKDLLDLFYFPPNSKKYFRRRAKKFDIKFTIDKFLTQKESSIESDCIEINMAERKLHLKKVLSKDFNYTVRPFVILWPIIFCIAYGTLHYLERQEANIFMILFIAILPWLFIEMQYLAANSSMAVHLSRGKDEFLVSYKGVTIVYDKNDINRIDFYSYDRDGTKRKGGFAYLKIKFNNSKLLHLTSLLINAEDMLTKFREQEVVKHNIIFPYIRNFKFSHIPFFHNNVGFIMFAFQVLNE